MGTDCKIRLPTDVRVGDVAKVMGILSGLKAERMPLDRTSYAVRVPGASVAPSSIPECCYVNLNGKLVRGDGVAQAFYHFEPSGGVGRLLMPRSTAFWICIGRGLVKFFGGSVDYNDCDNKAVDFRAKKPRKRNNPENDKEWHDFQDAMLAVKPITKSQLHLADKLAAYH